MEKRGTGERFLHFTQDLTFPTLSAVTIQTSLRGSNCIPRSLGFIRGHVLACCLLKRERLVGIGGGQGCVGLFCSDRLDLSTLVIVLSAKNIGWKYSGVPLLALAKRPWSTMANLHKSSTPRSYCYITSHYAGMGVGWGVSRFRGKFYAFWKRKIYQSTAQG